MKKCGYSYNLMLKKTPYHIIFEQKRTPISAAHPYTDTYKKLPPPLEMPTVRVTVFFFFFFLFLVCFLFLFYFLGFVLLVGTFYGMDGHSRASGHSDLFWHDERRRQFIQYF